MGLAEINSRDAVLDAIDTYEDLGASVFLQRYGAGLGGAMTIEYIGRVYPALPVLNAAHEGVVGDVLAPEELTEPLAQPRLERLGFRVSGAAPVVRARASSSRGTRSPSQRRAPAAKRVAGSPRSVGQSVPNPGPRVIPLAWNVEPDDLRTRQELASSFGVSKHATVDTSKRARSVLAFLSPSGGLAHRVEGEVYLVTGDGRRGNQSWNAANKSLLEHREDGLALRLFEECDEPWRPGGKRVRYVGEFMVDAQQPWHAEKAQDADGKDRQVIVFRLVPTGPAAETARDRGRSDSIDHGLPT